jgi:hypothetical protein
MKRIAILGCGPSGLLAAHAAKKLGQDVAVLSLKERSPILGGQYLHMEVKGITGAASSVTYIKIGDTEGYSQKVYGKPDVPCFRFPAGEYPAWSLTEAYGNLWDIWRDKIEDFCVTADDVDQLCEEYDLVLCTIPRSILCFKEDHKFYKQMIRVVQGGTLLSPHIENVVLYSGRPKDSWYRTSNLFGHHTTEWSEASVEGVENRELFDLFDLPPNEDEPHQEVALMGGFKPLSHTCDCHGEYDNFVWLGRFGRWAHGVLVSDAFEQAQTAIKEVERWQR